MKKTIKKKAPFTEENIPDIASIEKAIAETETLLSQLKLLLIKRQEYEQALTETTGT